MTSSETPSVREERLFKTAEPYLRKLLRDAPDFGEVTLAVTLHDGAVGRIRVGAEVSRIIAPRAERGTK